MFNLCQVSTGHHERYFNNFLRPVSVRTPCKPHFCSLPELHVLCISRDKPTTKLTHIERGHREVNPGRIGERQRLSPLHHLCSPNKICCFRSRFCSDSVVKTILSASVSDTLTEIAVVSSESRFARRRSPGHWSIRLMTYNTLQHGENAFRGVILVTLGFHMCSHRLSMHIPFFQD